MQHSMNVNLASVNQMTATTTNATPKFFSMRGFIVLFKAGQARVGNAFKTFRYALQVKRERRALESLSAEQLHDIGIHQSDASKEYSRPLFDLPPPRH